MDEYKRKASADITRAIWFTDNQLDLVGRCLSLNEDSKLVRAVQVDYSQMSLHGQPILELGKPQQVHVYVKLQPSMKSDDHDEIMERIRRALQKKDVDTKGLFSYCQKSYGIEREDIGVDIGFGFSG